MRRLSASRASLACRGASATAPVGSKLCLVLKAASSLPYFLRSRVESDRLFKAALTLPVSYMSHRDQSRQSCKFITHRSLLVADVSPLSHLHGYSGSYSARCPEGSSEDCPAGYPERNLESYPDCYSVNCRASYLEGNSESYPESSGDRCCAGSPADSPDNRSVCSPESNLPSCWENNPESNPPDSSVGSLPRQHDLANTSRVPCPSSLAPDEIHPRRQPPHIVRAGREAHHLPAIDSEK